MQQAQAQDAFPIPINFTDSAARRVKELIAEEGNPSLMLRVFITGGGCSGFQYGFAFEEAANTDDTVIEKEVKDEAGASDAGIMGGVQLVKLLVDPMSFQYLIGAEIDYKNDATGEQFIIRNPNAKTTCGCGSSFSTGD